jgi:uracil-DNA glycosylase
MFLKDLLPTNWQNHLTDVIRSDGFRTLSAFVEESYNSETCYPEKTNIFKVFKLLPLEHIKVVILGQDPYHGEGQAQGLSFSVPNGQKIPPSLINIFKEITVDTHQMIPQSGDLQYLANQGVFLLNAILTVEAKKPGSHQNKGWEKFTDAVIQLISEKNKAAVFMLWGNYALKKEKLIDNHKHLVLKSGHPSPMSANQGKWFGNNHFNLANDYLKSHQIEEIKWLNNNDLSLF